MKKVLMFVVLVSFGFAFICISSCSSLSKKTKAESISSSDIYSCPMHPEVKSDEPGKCPKCGMNLEKPPFRHAVLKEQQRHLRKYLNLKIFITVQ